MYFKFAYFIIIKYLILLFASIRSGKTLQKEGKN